MKKILIALLLVLGVVGNTYAQGVTRGGTAPATVVGTGSIDAITEGVTIPNVSGYGTLGVQLTGTFTGTIAPQCSLDGTTFVAVEMKAVGSSSTVTEMTSTGIW